MYYVLPLDIGTYSYIIGLYRRYEIWNPGSKSFCAATSEIWKLREIPSSPEPLDAMEVVIVKHKEGAPRLEWN